MENINKWKSKFKNIKTGDRFIFRGDGDKEFVIVSIANGLYNKYILVNLENFNNFTDPSLEIFEVFGNFDLWEDKWVKVEANNTDEAIEMAKIKVDFPVWSIDGVEEL